MNLQRQIDELGLHSRVRLAGFCQDTRSFYESLDLFVLSSHREGLPNVVLEAMSVGCPVVATEVDGVPRIITNQSDGVLVPAGSTEELAKGIHSLVYNREIREQLACNGVETIRRRWSFQSRMKRISNIYLET